ncbi:hypothetical protein PCC7424_1829 [Gloeothece citriformis PCC 7424]|uniref:Uncharacterized protein n=1 Tax=Gloeothece citriformis (strain PCC 7424) TaxID=65393 RepID=B7KCF6_GLOC7|nr:hypothetical protein [Gloeothece citriformis]ACK70261.1 hypothetical protein PCC7424_1829 [Gloeothece citriformis PCC 7424]
MISRRNFRKINRSWVTILGLGWLSFVIFGLIIQTFLAAPNVVLLVERSYCPPQQWQKMVEVYANSYQQHQQQHLKIEKVILFSDLGEEIFKTLPTPDELLAVKTYGRSSSQRQKQLKNNYPKSQILKCP